MASTATVLRPYETLFIVPPETPQDKIDAFVEKLKATILKDGGEFKSVQVWGRRRMAYPIKRYKDGLYVYVDFDGTVSSVKAVDTLHAVTDFIIRYLTVDREYPNPKKIKVRKPLGQSPTPGAVPAPASAPAVASPTLSKESPSQKQGG